jgi:putative ABC transport system permease protein
MHVQNLFSVVVNQDSESPNEPSAQAGLRQQLAERLRTVPGVISTSQVLRQPLTGKLSSTSITVDDQPLTSRPMRANYNVVSPNHFETVGVQIIRGRSFTESEARSGAPVVVISESTARKFWPKSTDIGEVIGHRIGIAAAVPETETANHETRNFPSFEIVGIARDTRSGWVWEIDQTYLYVPVTPVNHSAEYILVRTKGDPGRVMASVQDEAANINPHLRVFMERISANLDLQMTPFRGLAIVALILGLMAMLLAAIGLHGVMSFVIARRTKEIGIRVALGARPLDVVRLLLNHGLRLILLGIVVGLAGGVAIAKLLSAVLVDLSPLDPIAFGSVTIFLVAVGLVSSWLPARRAARVDPLVALKYE